MSSFPEDLDDYELWEDLDPANEPRASTSTDKPVEPSKGVILRPEGVHKLDPRLICHPRLAECSPPDHIDQYLTYWLRHPLDKEVRTVCNRLRAECLRPTVSHKVLNTHKLYSFLSNYVTK